MRKLILLSSLLTCTALCFGQSGILDPTFGNQGIVTTDMDSASNYANAGNQVLTQPDGSMYLVSHSAGLLRISKKHPDGSIDLSYGKNGYSVSAAVYSPREAINAALSQNSGPIAALQPDGKIVAVGFTLNGDQYDNLYDFGVARFNTNGTLDSSFGSNGIQVTDFGLIDVANAVCIQSDGKIIVVGYGQPYLGFGMDSRITLARYNTDGSLDNSFSGDGMQTFNMTPTDFYIANSVAVQNDGKIVVAGNVLLRYDSTGNLDTTFNGTGIQSIPGVASAVAIQSDGKILTGGTYISGANNYGFAITRFDSTGIVDSSFDVDGVQTTDFGGANNVLASMVIQPNGKILAAGYTGSGSNNNFAIARYNTDGSPDNSFSGDGMQTTDFSSADDHLNSIAIQSDGAIVALGYTASGANTYIASARYDAAGNPDNSFDGDGTLTDHITQGSTFYTCTAIQSDGKVLAAGYTWNGSNYDFALARYNTNGSLDSTFSSDGEQTADLDSLDDKANAIVIQSDGKIVIGGSAGNNFGLARFNTDGSPDISFDGDGMKTDMAAPGAVSSLGLFSDGTILAAGTSLMRYNTDGSPDMAFGVNGKVTIPYKCLAAAVQTDDKIVITGGESVARYNSDGSADDTFSLYPPVFPGSGEYYWTGTSIAIQNDGKIVIGGSTGNSFKIVTAAFALWRLKPDGTSDSTFNGTGTLVTDLGGNATSVAVQNDDKIIVGGYSYNGNSNVFSLQRLNVDGSADNTFGNNGTVITRASTANNAIAGIAIANGKLYAAGYGQYPGNFGVVARYFLTEGALPVSLLDFTGILQNKSVLLQWKIATPKNLTGFIIERSGDGNSFLPINAITATGISTSTRDYSVMDEQPLQGINFYRLKLVDADGKFTYSNIVAVKINSDSKLRIFPNPAAKILFVEASGSNENAIVQIVDAGGRKLKEMKISLNGTTSFSIDISNLATGFYNLILRKNEKIEVQRFIKR